METVQTEGLDTEDAGKFFGKILMTSQNFDPKMMEAWKPELKSEIHFASRKKFICFMSLKNISNLNHKFQQIHDKEILVRFFGNPKIVELISQNS